MRERRELRAALAFLLPNFLGFVVFTSGPVLFSLAASFTNRNLHHPIPFRLGIDAPQWVLSTRNLFGLEVENVHPSAQQWGIGARDAIILMGIWTAIGGNNMLLYLAALTNVPPELTEAAELDGASKWQLFRHVTWPQLAPTTFFIVVMSFIGGLQGGFEQARVMTAGGPAGTTTTLAYYIYTKAFEEFQIGYASAVAWVLFAAIFAITLVNWK